MTAAAAIPPRHILFDATAEIFATDVGGSFSFPLTTQGEGMISTQQYDEARFVVSLWHPSVSRSIDLDRSYVEIRACFDPEEQHWIKLAEVEPLVPPHGMGDSFDGWVVLPVMAAESAFAVVGSGFEPRARLQIRTSLYLVA